MVLKCLYGDVIVKGLGPDAPEMAYSLWRTHILLQSCLPRLELDICWVLWVAGLVLGLSDLVKVMCTSYQWGRHVNASVCCW